ncbi:hypothetical protein B0J14DRAFT_695199 [Halenospora varia]|nr:hypothetical protein B0J14DRAFT_695199 [Halenospora varia]
MFHISKHYETKMAPAQIIDLTASPSPAKPPRNLDENIKQAIMTATSIVSPMLEVKGIPIDFSVPPNVPIFSNQPGLPSALAEFDWQAFFDTPEASLLAAPSLNQSEDLTVLEELNKKRKRKIRACNECGNDADENDGCCKWRRMHNAEIEEARWTVEWAANYDSEGERICDNCGLDANDPDGCCKSTMMRNVGIQEARDKLRHEKE